MAVITEEMDKILEAPLIDFDFEDEWDNKIADPSFQIDSNEKVIEKQGRFHFCKNDGEIYYYCKKC